MANVRDIFFEAMDVPFESRQAFLDRACGGNAVLRSEVEALLNKWQVAGTFMEAPAVPRDDLQTPDLRGEPTQEGDPSRGPALTFLGSPTRLGRTLPAGGTGFPVVPGYEIQAELGRGGMGVVYAARQVAANRIVALKTIRPGQDGPTRERFRREAEAAAGLRHPGVIEIFDVGEAAAGPYFSMEYCPDGNLDEYLRGRPLGGEEASRLVSSLARAVAAAHDSGLLHRDIKPGNVMLAASRLSHETEEGAAEERRPLAYFLPKLTDFGLAKRVGDDKLTQTGMLMGTPSYMSPEQASGDPDLGVASDVYSLGAVLYECLTGRPPFLAATPVLTLAMVIDQEAVPPRRLQPALPKDLETVCMKCLEKNPDRRYVTAGELADDLDRFLTGRPITARPAGPIERTYKWVRRNAMLTTSAAAVVLSLATGVVISTFYAIEAAQERDLKDKALTAESEQRRQAERALEVSDAIKDLLLEDLIGQADASRQMIRLGAEQRESEFIPDPTVRELLERAAESLTDPRIEERFPGRPLVQADILRSVGQIVRVLAQYDRAADYLERAERRYAVHAGTEAPDTLVCRNSLAVQYLDAGRLDQAVSLLERVLHSGEQVLGVDHPVTLTSQNNLAYAYLAAGRLDEAIPLFERTLDQRKTILGDEHPDTLISRNSLGVAYSTAGRMREAVPLFERTLQLSEATLSDEHPDTLTSRNNLARAYSAAGRLNEAIPLFERTLQQSEATLGDEHPDTLTSRNNLAYAYERAGRLDEAIPLFERTLKQRKAKLGDEHPRTLSSGNNLAGAYESAGRLNEAIPLFEYVLESRQRKLGDAHPSTLYSRNNLAYAYKSAGRLGEAIPLFERTLKQGEALLGDEHPHTLSFRHNLASAYERTGRLDEAIPLHERTLKQREAKLGDEHPDTLSSRSSLAKAYERAGRLDEAIPLHERTLKQREAKLGDDHPDTLLSRNSLAVSYWKQGRLDKSVPVFETLLQQNEKKRGANHPETLTVKANLGINYKSAGRFNDAIPLLESVVKQTATGPDWLRLRFAWVKPSLIDAYEEAELHGKAEPYRRAQLEEVRRQHGDNDARVASRLASLSNNLLRQGKAAEAEPLLRECLTIRQDQLPDSWLTANAESMLGEALLGQQNYTEAEKHLIAGYDGMKTALAAAKSEIPVALQTRILGEALDRLVRLAEATGKSDQAKQWRAERAELPDTSE